jgi:dipeptidyl aminopeptidase/acylaminoacyl peptidase
MTRRVTLILFILAAIVHADDFDTWFGASPDNKLFAVERRIPSSDIPSRLDLDSCTVFISSAAGGDQRSVIAQHTFPGRIISQVRWSPDSQFLLFTTASSGGHSPWHFKTYVFCVADRSFRDVQGATHATIGAAEFSFEYPDVVVLTVNVVPAERVKRIKLPLAKAVQQMERLP